LSKLGDVDIFYHSWEVSQLTNPRTGETGLTLDTSEVSRWLPEARGLFESQEPYDRSVDWEPLFANNIMRHCTADEDEARATLMNYRRALESQERAWRYFEETKQKSYTHVIATRGDLKFLQELQIDALSNLENPPCLWIPQFHGWGGVNDRFALGGEREIGIYSNRSAFADGWLTGGGQGNSEQILMHWLQRNHIQTQLLDFTFQRIRANGEITPMDLDLTPVVPEPTLAIPEITTPPLKDRFLILARQAGPASQRLLDTFTPLGKAEVITDSPQGGGTWYPDELLPGYHGLMGFSSNFPPITAWSRAMYHLSQTLEPDQAVWFIEDDVAGSPAFFQQLVAQTSASGADLAARDIYSKADDGEWDCWSLAEPWFQHPVRAFQPLCRVSSRLIAAALEFRQAHGEFAFQEILFATLAATHGMHCLDWSKHIEHARLFGTFRFRPAVEWAGYGICHPVKQDSLHASICHSPLPPWSPDSSYPLRQWFQDDFEQWQLSFTTEEPVRGLEIGTTDPASAHLLLGNLFLHPQSELHCIQHNCISAPEPTLPALDTHGKEVHHYDGESAEILAWMIAEEGYWQTFDFIHHTGGNTASNLLTDACQSWHLLKPGGVMVFRIDEGNESSNARLALNAFRDTFSDHIQIIRDGNTLVLSKSSPPEPTTCHDLAVGEYPIATPA
jgi:hypothetical protein